MSASTPYPGSEARARGRFATTHWSVVLAAGRQSSADSRKALEILCRTYWYPLYAYMRRRGYPPDQAQDCVQGFFAYLLEKGTIRAADRRRGRFRTFLLTVFQRFLGRMAERRRARKRGAGRRILSLDVATGERRYRREPFHQLTAEKLYQRRWALTLLERVLHRLEMEYADKGKAALFEALRAFLTGEGDILSYREVGSRLRRTEGAVKVAVHRLRRRYRELLREEIAHTVDEPDDVEDELNCLLLALQGESR